MELLCNIDVILLSIYYYRIVLLPYYIPYSLSLSLSFSLSPPPPLSHYNGYTWQLKKEQLEFKLLVWYYFKYFYCQTKIVCLLSIKSHDSYFNNKNQSYVNWKCERLYKWLWNAITVLSGDTTASRLILTFFVTIFVGGTKIDRVTGDMMTKSYTQYYCNLLNCF